MKIKMLALISLSSVLFGCGGDDDSDSLNQRMMTLEELESALPVDAQGTNSSLAGLWLMQLTSQMSVDTNSEDDSVDELHYLHGRQVALITETEDGFHTSFCGSYAVQTDLNFASADGAEGTSYSAGLVDDQTHFNLDITDNREMTGELTVAHDDEVTGDYQFLGVKLSDATSFAAASNEMDITASLTVNGVEYAFSELGTDVTCVGSSAGSAENTADSYRTDAFHVGFTTVESGASGVSLALGELSCPQNMIDGSSETAIAECDTASLVVELESSSFEYDEKEVILDSGFSVTSAENTDRNALWDVRIGLPGA